MKHETSRVREHGIIVTVPSTGEERIAAIKGVVAQKQYAKIDGVMIDLFSASAILKVYDAISPANQAKYRELKAYQMGAVAFKLLK